MVFFEQTYFAYKFPYWGKGSTAKEAIAEYVKQGGTIKALDITTQPTKSLKRVTHPTGSRPFIDDTGAVQFDPDYASGVGTTFDYAYRTLNMAPGVYAWAPAIG